MLLTRWGRLSNHIRSTDLIASDTDYDEELAVIHFDAKSLQGKVQY